jgi:hypothetical protein
MTEKNRHDYLRRLPDGFYRGRAMVYWTMTIQGRRCGWLTGELHLEFREVLLHTLARFRLYAPSTA